ncbi:hypothetical protein HOY82DRAFT_553711 [Tuber indicum]|nr:hypothetical protein HOY82DRAFT_553711 [Tuber indicum]
MCLKYDVRIGWFMFPPAFSHLVSVVSAHIVRLTNGYTIADTCLALLTYSNYYYFCLAGSGGLYHRLTFSATQRTRAVGANVIVSYS